MYGLVLGIIMLFFAVCFVVLAATLIALCIKEFGDPDEDSENDIYIERKKK